MTHDPPLVARVKNPNNKNQKSRVNNKILKITFIWIHAWSWCLLGWGPVSLHGPSCVTYKINRILNHNPILVITGM